MVFEDNETSRPFRGLGTAILFRPKYGGRVQSCTQRRTTKTNTETCADSQNNVRGGSRLALSCLEVVKGEFRSKEVPVELDEGDLTSRNNVGPVTNYSDLKTTMGWWRSP